jgi:hypothetical protein
VLDDMERRGIEPPLGTLVDWGAGTGIATRAWLARFAGREWDVRLVERSAAARGFARERIAAEHPAATIGERACAEPDVLLVSHVLDELDEQGRDELVELARASRFVVWVESGAKGTARALSELRERLLDVHTPLAPCPHANACGVLAAGKEGDWCHHFARPAPEAFTTRHWALFSREMGIDMRSLPYSYLVLARKSAGAEAPAGRARILGRPEILKGRARLDVCEADGVRTLTFLERTDKKLFRALADAAGTDLLVRLDVEGDRILRLERGDG